MTGTRLHEVTGVGFSEVTQTSGRVRLTLPVPPSANRWWRNVNGRMVTSQLAREYKANIGKLRGLHVARGLVSVSIDWYRERKSGDLDKRLGIVLDSLQGVLFFNDSQIVELTARRYDDKVNPRVVVTVDHASLCFTDPLTRHEP